MPLMTPDDIRNHMSVALALAVESDEIANGIPDRGAQARLMFRRAAVALRDAYAFVEAGTSMLPQPAPADSAPGNESAGGN